METDAAFFVHLSNSPRLKIRCHGGLVEVVDSDREMIYFAWRLTRPQDQEPRDAVG